MKNAPIQKIENVNYLECLFGTQNSIQNGDISRASVSPFSESHREGMSNVRCYAQCDSLHTSPGN